MFGLGVGRRGALTAFVAVAFVTACSETGGLREAASTPEQTGDYETDSIPAQANARLYPIETGIAAWDGALATEGMTAAHPTLPLDSWVRVTNARTGQSTMVQVDRRLPRSRGRQIELSRDAAAAVGALQNGVATVMIEPVEQLRGDASVVRGGAGAPVAAPVTGPSLVASAPPVDVLTPVDTFGGSDWNPNVATGSIPSVPAPSYSRFSPDPIAQTPVYNAQYLQVGAFRDPRNARRLIDRLQSEGMAGGSYGGAFVEAARVNGQLFHRVRVGPFVNQSQAQRALRDAQTLGHTGARIVTR